MSQAEAEDRSAREGWRPSELAVQSSGVPSALVPPAQKMPLAVQ